MAMLTDFQILLWQPCIKQLTYNKISHFGFYLVKNSIIRLYELLNNVQ